MFDRRLLECFNWGFLGLMLTLVGAGLLTLYSAVTAGESDPQIMAYYKQMVWYGVGLTLMLVTFFFDYRLLDRWAYLVWAVCIVLLIAVLFYGKYVGGSRRWLALGSVSVQPSELIKVGMVVVLARCYSRNLDMRGLTPRDLFRPAILVAVPFGLIINQPDLGTGLLMVLIAASMTAFVKIERKTMISIVVAGVVAVPMVWGLLKDYQRRRILTFLDPDRDPLGAGYHIIQSKIAIGSGMATGKGLFKGTQSSLSFLPEQHTDFIFSVWAEEMGFIGAAALIMALLLVILWGLNVAYGCRDAFGIILCVGATSVIFWQTMINIAMVMGLMPVVGMPLPFISYGGSSTITIILCMSILLNVSMRRFVVE